MKAMHELRIFVETARLGSLSASARALDLSPAVTSAAIKRLEKELGQALFIRSTRQLRLTQHGVRFLVNCQQALDLIDDGCAAVRDNAVALSGTIQLSAPSGLGRHFVSDWLGEFMELHPQLRLRLHLSDSLTDLYRMPVDLLLRYGQPADSNLVAIPINHSNYRILCASPEYLEQHGQLRHPEDLTEHNCLCFSIDGAPLNSWQLKSEQQSINLKVSGNRIANDGELVHRWTVQGHGIAFKSLLDVSNDIRSGRLIRLCNTWHSDPVPLNLLCASRSQLNPTVRALSVFLQERVERQLAGLI